ncbi:MAG TPA: class I SAM-dependent methyltransferase [Alphaproteobacteria bacterium]|nr:class I SAM-dependent methyltransferase [Alphaproteobacteria bacterium]
MKEKRKEATKRKPSGKQASRRRYDSLICAHYDSVAAQFGASPQSTMADEIVRAKETNAILDFVGEVARAWRSDFSENGGYARRPNGDRDLLVADVGCGNGYTLNCLAERAPLHRYVGVEQNDNLRAIAKKRTENTSVRVMKGDIRDLGSIAIDIESVDILICQRVLINLLHIADQRLALKNLVELAKPGAALIFIESFRSGWNNLNAARAEFALEPIPPATHNLPLPDDIFDVSDLVRIDFANIGFSENILSTHFFVSRVLHEIALKSFGTGFTRNSHFVRFLSAALPDAIGDYAPLRITTLMKRRME